MSKEKETTDVVFVERGNELVMKQNKPTDFVMDSREVMVQIDSIENAIEKTNAQMEQIKTNLIHGEKTNKINQKRLNQLKKFEPKMKVIQESLARAIYAEIKEECKKQIDETYIYDKGLTEEQNKIQKYKLYERAIGTHEKAATQLAPKIITKMYYKESILDNPWE